MHNYKALKAASKTSVQKVEVVDRAKVDEVKDEDGNVTTHSQSEVSHEELQVVCKKFDPDTGEAQSDSTRSWSLSEVKYQVDNHKKEITRLQAEQADWEQLETDLKAL